MPLINFFTKVRYRYPAFFQKFDAGAGQFLKSPANRILRSDVKGVIFGPNFSGKVRDRQRTFFGKFDSVDQLFYKSWVTLVNFFTKVR